MTPNLNYFKPWRTIFNLTTTTLTTAALTGTSSVIFTAAQLGLSPAIFPSGTYYFEFRFIGATSIYPVCRTLSITIP